MRVIVSGEAKPIKDDGEKHLSLLSLHDACYGLDHYSECSIEKADGSLVPPHESLRPMTMKKPYDLFGEGCYLSILSDEFIIHDIYPNTGLTLKEWLNMTRVEQKIIKKSVDRKKKLQTTLNQEANNEMERAINETKK